MINAVKFNLADQSRIVFLLSLFLTCVVNPAYSFAGSTPLEKETTIDGAFTIATDRPGSTHAQVGEIICNVYNRSRPTSAAICRSIYSPGGTRQLTNMRSGRVQMAIMQSDVVAAAIKGEKKFKENKELRVLLPLHEQILAVTMVDVMSIRELDIKTLSSLRVGMPSSIRNGRFTLTTLFNDLGVNAMNSPQFRLLNPAEQMTALCEGRIDVGLALLGHPNGAIQQGVHDCGVTLIPFDFPALRRVIENSSHWNMGKIRDNTYVDQDTAVNAPAVTALLMTTKAFDRQTGEAFVRILRENQHVLRRLHRALSDLDLDRKPAALRKLKLFGQD